MAIANNAVTDLPTLMILLLILAMQTNRSFAPPITAWLQMMTALETTCVKKQELEQVAMTISSLKIATARHALPGSLDLLSALML